jgi:MFS family permease
MPSYYVVLFYNAFHNLVFLLTLCRRAPPPPTQFNGTLAFYGLVFAAYSLAHFLACLAFGWLADRRPIKELLAAVCAERESVGFFVWSCVFVVWMMNLPCHIIPRNCVV